MFNLFILTKRNDNLSLWQFVLISDAIYFQAKNKEYSIKFIKLQDNFIISCMIKYKLKMDV